MGKKIGACPIAPVLKETLMRSTLLVLCLAACAIEPDYRWDRPGTPQEQIVNDSAQCEQQALSIPSSDQQRIVMSAMSCMVGRGYRLVER